VTVTAKLTKCITGYPLANKEVDSNDYNSNFIGSNITNEMEMYKLNIKYHYNQKPASFSTF
jgi:hypothetical protein